MKAILASLVFLASASAFAHNSWDMSCHEARLLVASHGAAIIHTSANTYDRYVKSDYYCEQSLMTKPAWIMTADTDECFVGYTCVSQSENGG